MKLKACKRCGSDPEVVRSSIWISTLQCSNLSCNNIRIEFGPYRSFDLKYKNKAEAVDAWNKEQEK